ncbi:copper resistance protein CopZ [Planococcus glaciei]|uniref:Copper chaperone CopZ n=2 Tax=Caryophanaceae TaxID=186818 RepID=A0A7H8QGU2_9BACL|nr:MULTISPECIES: copper chaperone CopZ [Planococcus]KOF11303.1 copper resistance protein CopZ [Planococcus glaciei]QDY46679.1 copper chaperone CopZ [Planococcus glaciei]QKX52771.1 copper chaperone CopZ [Planococcus glaciei]
MMNETLKVQGMSCAHCVNAVESSVGELQGVSSVKVDLGKGEVTVAYDNSKTSLNQIQETIEDQGYDVV